MAIFTARQLHLIAVLFALGTFLSGCSFQLQNNSDSGDLDVQLPMPVQRNDEGETTSQAYEYQIVKLLNVFEIKKVRGEYARFYLNPTTTEEKRLTGVFPTADFLKNKKNIYTPTSDLSVQMASIYFHMQNLAMLDRKMGVGDVNHWPRDIGLSVKIPTVSETGDLRLMENNAIYDGAYDAILLVPNRSEQLPIAVNGGILAHEHFHSLFFKIVTRKLIAEKKISPEQSAGIHDHKKLRKFFPLLEDTSSDLKSGDGNQVREEEIQENYDIVLLDALNEGLADFWGWLYTNDVNFIIHSLPGVNQGRSLKLSKIELENLTLPTREKILTTLRGFAQKSDSFRDSVNGYAYDLGTQFARHLKAFVSLHQNQQKISLGQSKEKIAKAVVDFLPKLSNEFVVKSKGQMLAPHDLALKLIEGIENLTTSECESVIAVFNREKTDGSMYKCENLDGKVKIK